MGLKVKKKRKPAANPAVDETPEERKARIKAERIARIEKYKWKPGQSGNPLGRRPGSGSIVHWLKKRLQGPAIKAKYETLAQELAELILQNARRGNYNFVQMLLDKAESRQMTEEEMQLEIEKFFNVVTKHVKDEGTLAAIARDLGLNANQGEVNDD